MAVATPTGKRTDYISWDEYFMATAAMFAMQNEQRVGGCVVNDDNKIVCIVYDEVTLDSESNTPLGHAMCHQALREVLRRAGKNVTGCRIYLVRFPCYECAKALVDFGLSGVVYLRDRESAATETRALLVARGFEIRRFVPDQQRMCITIDFGQPSALSIGDTNLKQSQVSDALEQLRLSDKPTMSSGRQARDSAAVSV